MIFILLVSVEIVLLGLVEEKEFNVLFILVSLVKFLFLKKLEILSFWVRFLLVVFFVLVRILLNFFLEFDVLNRCFVIIVWS